MFVWGPPASEPLLPVVHYHDTSPCTRAAHSGKNICVGKTYVQRRDLLTGEQQRIVTAAVVNKNDEMKNCEGGGGIHA